MSESEITSFTPRRSCECYKKLQTYGIPLHISDENEFLSEYPTMLTYESAFPLPNIMTINEDIMKYPDIEDSELSLVFQQMAEVIPSLSDFEENVLSFYILDIIIEGLWTAQNAKMNFNNQKVFLHLSEQNPSRKELFEHLKIVLFCNKKNKGEDERRGEFDKTSRSNDSKTLDSNLFNQSSKVWNLPLPPDYNSYNKEKISNGLTSDENVSTINDQETEIKTLSSTSVLKRQICENETNANHMKIILEILYRIFARFWVYIEIQTVFNSMPPAEKVNLPFVLNTPKLLLKVEPTFNKGDKAGKRQSLLEKSSEASEFLQLFKNDFILPLQVAEEAKLFMKSFIPQNSQRSALGRNKEDKNKK